jgi:hypothetical protein
MGLGRANQRLVARIERRPLRCLSCALRAVQTVAPTLEVSARGHVRGVKRGDAFLGASKDGFTAARNTTSRDHLLVQQFWRFRPYHHCRQAQSGLPRFAFLIRAQLALFKPRYGRSSDGIGVGSTYRSGSYSDSVQGIKQCGTSLCHLAAQSCAKDGPARKIHPRRQGQHE